ncbi:hypothetical protein [Blastococcus sp. SYSU D00813]
MRITRRALARPLVVLAIAGSLTTACSNSGGNTDVDRNEQECGTAENSGDCAETEGPPTATTESEG